MTNRFILGLLLAASLAGCSGGGSSTGSSSVSSPGSVTGTVTPAGTGTASTQILLQGVPPSSVTVGGPYSFTPSVSSGSNVVTFSIEGQPSWTAFDTTTGRLSGTPATGNLGLSGPITIVASDGANTASLGPFTILVNPAASASASPTISGAPLTSVVIGRAYSFTPATTDPST